MNESLLDQGIWIALSVGIAILAGVVSVYLDQQYQRSPQPKLWWHFLRNRRLNDALRLLYAVGIPATALFTQGVLTYRGLGLKFLPWSPSFIDRQRVLLTWQQDSEVTLAVILVTSIILYCGLRSVGQHQKNFKPGLVTATISALYEGIIEQVHWSFYREICISVWGITQGSWIAVLPITLELLLNPATWTRIKDQNGVNSLVFNCGIFIASAILFIQTQNLWLMVLMDIVFRLLFARVFITSKRL